MELGRVPWSLLLASFVILDWGEFLLIVSLANEKSPTFQLVHNNAVLLSHNSDELPKYRHGCCALLSCF
jgi:hypothetical protein